jgi:uncharacterized Zn-finger protein
MQIVYGAVNKIYGCDVAEDDWARQDVHALHPHIFLTVSQSKNTTNFCSYKRIFSRIISIC